MNSKISVGIVASLAALMPSAAGAEIYINGLRVSDPILLLLLIAGLLWLTGHLIEVFAPRRPPPSATYSHTIKRWEPAPLADVEDEVNRLRAMERHFEVEGEIRRAHLEAALMDAKQQEIEEAFQHDRKVADLKRELNNRRSG
jgi:hypothetical protein